MNIIEKMNYAEFIFCINNVRYKPKIFSGETCYKFAGNRKKLHVKI